jgi:DNA repair protein RadC
MRFVTPRGLPAWARPSRNNARVVRYRTPHEIIIMSPGLSGLEAAQVKAVRRRRKRNVCASDRLRFKWLRIDPCVSLPDDADELPPITSSRDAVRILHDSVGFAGRGVEYAMVLSLDSKNRPTSVAVSHIGGRASSLVEPSVVFQPPILSNAVGFIFAHNHPSGSAEPSAEDLKMTRKLQQGARLVGLTLLDALVVTDDVGVYTSFLDAGLLNA